MTLTETKGRFQFVIGIALFFPVVLDAIGKAGQMSEIASSEMTLKYAGTASMLLFAYLLLEILGDKIWTLLPKILNCMLMAEIGLFALTFSLVASMTGKTTEMFSSWDMWIYKADLFMLMIIPVVSFIMLAANLFWRIGEKIK